MTGTETTLRLVDGDMMTAAPRPGQTLGSYVVGRRLGEGGMATIYALRHTQLGTRLALKVLRDELSTLESGWGAQMRRRLLREGRIQASLDHRNVLRVVDVVRLGGGQIGLVMERASGPTLAQRLDEVGRLPVEEVDWLAMGILRGMRAAHQAGHVHRDLKPANVLLTLDSGWWMPKVADFGLAKEDRASVDLTISGTFMGTPEYAPEEQWEDASSVDARADVYALGALLFELLTGSTLHDAGDGVAAEAGRILGRRPDVPERMASAIIAALGPLDERPADAGALLYLWRKRSPRPPRPAPPAPQEHFVGFWLAWLALAWGAAGLAAAGGLLGLTLAWFG